MSEHDKLTNAFRVALGDGNGDGFALAEYGVTSGWDSMAHMQLIAEIEAVFDLMLTTDEVISLSSFERANEILKTHGVDVQA